MDKPTLDYYALHASEVAQRYEVAPSPLAHRFAESFSSGGRILDIGCGSGRDLARKLPQIENNMKIEASISLRRRDEEVKVHGEPDCCNLG